MDQIQVLEKIKTEILPEPKDWTTRWYARNQEGIEVFIEKMNDFDNISCCINGAFYIADKLYVKRDNKGIPDKDIENLETAESITFARLMVRQTCENIYNMSLITFNDAPERKHEEIIQLIDETIKELNKT